MLARTDPDRIRIETLEEENRQLRERIATLEGRGLVPKARLAFGFTEAEAVIFTMLYRHRVVEYGALISALYDDDKLCMIEEPQKAVRAHMKRLRRRTRPLGVDFSPIYGLGFEMSDEAHKAASAVMEGCA